MLAAEVFRDFETDRVPSSGRHIVRKADERQWGTWLEQIAVSGVAWKAAVDRVATSNITLSGEQTIDGGLTSTSRVGVVGQTNAAQNGIYVTAAGAWARATDANE